MRRDPLIRLPAALLRAPARAHGRYVMGIDGGATKTQAAVFDLEARAVHLAEGGPSNEDAVGPQAAVHALLAAADGALDRAGIGASALAATVVAVAGTDTDAIAHELAAARAEEWIVVNDVVGAWAAATGGEPGIGAISGTGSNVFGVGPQGRTWRVGGWGHLLGDDGSGYWLGLASIRAALRDRDGSGPPTALSDACVEFFGTESVEALAALMYAKPLSKGEIAAFAAEADRLAAQGDGVACELYVRAARDLADQVVTVIRRTGLAGEDLSGDSDAAEARAERFPVGLIGGAFKAGALFVEPLAAVVREAAPEARVSVVEMAPVGGSLQLAARACGRADELEADHLHALLEGAVRRERTTRAA